MGTPYQRQDVTNNIANGNIINASDLDAEFNAIEDAFAITTGHTHDGTAGEGGPVSIVGFGQELTIVGNQVIPKTNNTVDLGTSSLKFKNGYIDGRLYADEITLLSGADLQTTLDGKQPIATNLTAFGALSGAADKLPYFSGAGAFALTDLTTFGRSLINDADAAAARITLGLQINANVQGYSAVLASIGGNTLVSSDRFFYTSGLDTYSTAPVTPFARTLLASSTAADMRTTLDVAQQGAITTAAFLPSTLVTSSETIGSNNNNATIPTSAAVAAYVATNPWTFESADQTITSGSVLVLPHGLSAKPTEVQVVVKCTTTQAPFSVGEEIVVSYFIDSGTSYGTMHRADATNIRVVTASGGIQLLNNVGAALTLTNSSWRYVVRAR